MQNSARIICRNEADAFLSPQDEKSKELIKTFIRFGYKGIVAKRWSRALSVADLPQEWNYWRGTFPQGVKTGELHSDDDDRDDYDDKDEGCDDKYHRSILGITSAG